MWRNYLRASVRRLRQEPLYTLASVASLAVGMMAFLLILVYVSHERAYDDFHRQADRIYRLTTEQEQPSGRTQITALTPPPLAPTVQTEAPAIQEAVRLSPAPSLQVEANARSFSLNGLFADSSFFDVFSFEHLHGASDALMKPSTVVLARSVAVQLFGTPSAAVGQTLSISFRGTPKDVSVGAVVATPPRTSSIQFDVALPYALSQLTLPAFARGAVSRSWQDLSVHTFIQTRRDAGKQDVQRVLDRIVEERYGDTAAETTLRMDRLSSIHFQPDVQQSLGSPVDPFRLNVLTGLALLVLGIACLNFVALTLGQSGQRGQEVAVRKTFGAERGDVQRQYWSEALLLSGVATAFGVLGTVVALPILEEVAQVRLSMADLFTPALVGGLPLLWLGVGLIAGSYPTLVLARLRPATVLRGTFSTRGEQRLIEGMTVIQYAASIALLIGAALMYQQTIYLQEKDLGFTQDDLVVLHAGDTESGRRMYRLFQQEARRMDVVRNVTGTFFTFGHDDLSVDLELREGTFVSTYVNAVDAAFIETFGIDVVHGRNFHPDEAGGAALVNQAFVQAMGWEQPVGRTLPVASGTKLGPLLEGTRVVGVVEDYHHRSLYHSIKPLLLLPRGQLGGGVINITVAINDDVPIEAGLNRLEEVWETVFPNRRMARTILSERVTDAYTAELRARQLVTYASGFTLAVACLGFLGLASLTVRRRLREIGIRKMLGATGPQVYWRISRRFLVLVGVAYVVAGPLAYVAVRTWLQQFAYRVPIDLGPFVGVGLLCGAVALAASGYHVARASRTDPVDIVRRHR